MVGLIGSIPFERPNDVTLPQQKAREVVKDNKEISFVHKLILTLPSALQNTVWKLHRLIVEHPFQSAMYAGVIAAFLMHKFSLIKLFTFGYIAGGILVGATLQHFSNVPGIKSVVYFLRNLHREDRYLLTLSMIIASVIFPFFSGSVWFMCYFSMNHRGEKKPSEESRRQYGDQWLKDYHQNLAKDIERLVAHFKNDSVWAAHLLRSKAKVLLEMIAQVDPSQDAFVEAKNNYTACLEAYLRSIKKELTYESLYVTPILDNDDTHLYKLCQESDRIAREWDIESRFLYRSQIVAAFTEERVVHQYVALHENYSSKILLKNDDKEDKLGFWKDNKWTWKLRKISYIFGRNDETGFQDSSSFQSAPYRLQSCYKIDAVQPEQKTVTIQVDNLTKDRLIVAVLESKKQALPDDLRSQYLFHVPPGNSEKFEIAEDLTLLQSNLRLHDYKILGA